VSGGTWDYADFRLNDLADEVRRGHARWHAHGDPPLPMPAARGAMAAMLEVIARLLHELDYDFAGDAIIPDEQAWLLEAQAQIRATLDTFLETPQ
jgi:hypothetical protein